MRRTLAVGGLETVCGRAGCPNIGHCFERGTATFLVLGGLCTRSCRYCAIGHSAAPPPPEHDEPSRVAAAAGEMGLSYVVVTSVTRDDLPDGGASHMAATVSEVRRALPEARVELLVPDFGGSEEALRTIADSAPDVLNHNLETVKALFREVRPGASYGRSLELLALYGRMSPRTPLKSGLMLGLGETDADLERALDDLRAAGVGILTLGQYLSPGREHWPVDRYLHPTEFDHWRERALAMGFETVASAPLVRSSFHAETLFGEARGGTPG